MSVPGRSNAHRSGPVLAAVLRVAVVAAMVGGVAVLRIPSASALETPVPLGAASSFAVLAATTVTSTGATQVSGDVGVSPGTAITGFNPTGTVTDGAIYPGLPPADAAHADLATAYADAAGRGPAIPLASGSLGGQTIHPGLYASPDGTLGIAGTLTLDADGDPDAVFIFRAASTLTTAASNSTVTLTGGAQACNVFWQVGSSATLGVGTSFAGTLMATTSVTVNAGAAVTGRILARDAAVTLDNNIITRADCAGSLDIAAPATAILGTTVPGGALTGSLGAVTVTDTRLPAGTGWIATVVCTDFRSGAGAPNQTIPAERIDYWSGPRTASSGTGTFTPGQADAADASPLHHTTPLPAFSHAGGTGGNSVTWDPTLVIHVPPVTRTGTYTATVTHSVA